MPSHNHGYDKFNYNDYYYPPTSGSSYFFPCLTTGNNNFRVGDNTSSTGQSNPHNNMTPYITAYCWMRVS